MAPTVESNPFTSLGFRLVTKVSLISNLRSSRDLHLFSIAVGASQSAANDWKACSTSGALLFGERYSTRSTNTSFSNGKHMNYGKNPGNILPTRASIGRFGTQASFNRFHFCPRFRPSIFPRCRTAKLRIDRKSIEPVTMELCTEIDGAAAA